MRTAGHPGLAAVATERGRCGPLCTALRHSCAHQRQHRVAVAARGCNPSVSAPLLDISARPSVPGQDQAHPGPVCAVLARPPAPISTPRSRACATVGNMASCRNWQRENTCENFRNGLLRKRWGAIEIRKTAGCEPVWGRVPSLHRASVSGRQSAFGVFPLHWQRWPLRLLTRNSIDRPRVK